MKALWLENGTLKSLPDVPRPRPGPREALIRVRAAGFCSTDAALADGLYGFTGVPGHEFVGTVASGPEGLAGQRVVGEINIACGACSACRSGFRKHCRERTALGIRGRDGAFAEYLVLPVENLHRVPDTVSDEAAVFTEPLAAALDVIEQVELNAEQRILVVGDGKLAQLVCRVLALTGARIDVLGRHPRKLARLSGIVSKALQDKAPRRRYELAVECTGNAEALDIALDALLPRGTLVMKSTALETAAFDSTRVVVDELRLVGSRCGPFDRALELLAAGRVDPRPLIDGRYPIEEGLEGFRRSRERGVLKILLEMNS